MLTVLTRFRKLLLALTLTGLLGSALASYLAADRLLICRSRKLQPHHLAVLGESHRFGLKLIPFSVASRDGSTLAAHYITPAEKPGIATRSHRLQQQACATGESPPPHSDKNRGTILMFHGRGAIKEDLFPIAKRLCAAGFSCISFDARSSGESTGKFATYGHLEKHDATAILNTATAKFGHDNLAPFAAFGISRGGAEALQTAAIDPRLAAVVTVSTFSDLDQLMHEVTAHRLTHLARPLVPLVGLWCQARANFNPSSICPLDSVRSLNCPAMFIHGDKDTYIAPHHSQALYDALPNPAKHLKLIPGATHTDALTIGSDALYHDITAFLHHQLNPASSPIPASQ